MSIDALIPDDNNFNKGTAKGKKLIAKSIKKFGAGRGICVDKDNRIIAGNKTAENAKEAGIQKIIVVDAKPDELVVTRRADVSLDSEQGRGMALADNATGQANLAWDEDALAKAQEEVALCIEDWGLQFKEKDALYSRKIETPVYEPSGESPELAMCFDTTKADGLIAEINEADIPEDVKAFLRYAAMRHVEFNYGLIADYYCNAPKEVQHLFEQSALVIIDLKDAIRGGYVRMTEELFKTYADEN